MSIFTRFFGKKESDSIDGGQLTANLKIKSPLSLQVLFPDILPLDSTSLKATFREYHESMKGVRCEIAPELSKEGTLLGMVGWAKHVIRCVGFNRPMPADAVESCVAPSHYPQELKARARAPRSHVMLYYAGYESCPLEQYVALAAAAGALARLGALVVLNESGHTSFPAAALSGVDSDGDILELLHTLPLPILYCGFVKHEVEGIPGVWMRTYGVALLGLPDFAAHATGHNEGQRYFDVFDNIFRYLMDSGAKLAGGHTMQIDEDEFLRFRVPADQEQFLVTGDEVLVVELLNADEINK